MTKITCNMGEEGFRNKEGYFISKDGAVICLDWDIPCCQCMILEARTLVENLRAEAFGAEDHHDSIVNEVKRTCADRLERIIGAADET